MDARIASFRAALDGSRLSFFQYRLIAIGLLVLLTDGFDNYVVGFVVPVLSRLWHVAPSAFATVFAVGIVGLTVGAMVCSTLSDRFSARWTLITCTAIYAILTLLTALANSLEVLLVLRFVTGLALGGAMPSVIALVSDYSPRRVRTLMTTISGCGFALGGAAGGLVAAVAIAPFGWQFMFILGGAVPLLSLPLLVLWLPESLPKLLASRTPRARARKWLREIVPEWEVSPPLVGTEGVERTSRPVRVLFAAGYAGPTLLIWAAFICNLLLLYFLTAWLPTVVNSSGRSLALANVTTAVYQVGGIIGALTLAFLCDRTARPQTVLACAFLGAAICCLAIGQASGHTLLLMLGIAGAGFCVVGGQNASNAFVGSYYPLSARATGVGWALGVGRFGSIMGPLVGGLLIGLDVSFPIVFALLAVPAVLGCVCVSLVRSVPSPHRPLLIGA